MLEPHAKGDVIELLSISKFIEQGFVVSIPYGDNARYDFVVDTGKKIYKIQCKRARLTRTGNYTIRTVSTHWRSGKVVSQYYTPTEVDFFCTYIENEVYLVGIDLCEGRSEVTLHNSGPVIRDEYLYLEDCALKKLSKDMEVQKPQPRKVSVECKKEWCKKVYSHTKEQKRGRVPSKEEFEKAIQEYSIANAAHALHISRKRIFEVAKKYGIELKPGRDSERLRKRGVFRKTSIGLKTYYAKHNSPLAKKVVQKSKNGDVIATYASCMEAARMTGFSGATIRKACQHDLKTYRGFIWQFQDGVVAQLDRAPSF